MEERIKNIAICGIMLFPAILQISCAVHKSTYQPTSSTNTIPWKLGVMGSKGYSYYFNQSKSISEGTTLCIEKNKIDTGRNNYGITEKAIPVNFSGRKVKLTGYLKTDSLHNGGAGLWLRIDAETRLNVALKNMTIENPLSGTFGWSEYSIELPLTGFGDAGKATEIHFGAMSTGTGKLCIDTVQLLVDNIPIEKVNHLTPHLFNPTNADITKLKKQLINIQDFGEDGIRNLVTRVDNHSIIALGECTHGTEDFFKLKNKLIKYLIEHKGFTTIAIEDNLLAVEQINKFVLTGTGNINDLMEELYPIWQTKEVYDLITWIRNFNLRLERNVQFVGFDMQSPRIAIKNLKEHFIMTNNQTYAKLVDSLGSISEQIFQLKKNERLFVLKSAIEIATDIQSHSAKNTLSENFENECKVLLQYFQNHLVNQPYFRDSCMAENLSRIKKESPDTKIIIWAHNYHISKRNYERMGWYLNQNFQKDYYALAMSTNSGTYSPYQFTKEEAIIPGPKGTMEYFLSLVPIENYFIDLKKLRIDDLKTDIPVRHLGGLASKRQFITSNVKKEYDGFLFIKQTKASKHFKGSQ